MSSGVKAVYKKLNIVNLNQEGQSCVKWGQMGLREAKCGQEGLSGVKLYLEGVGKRRVAIAPKNIRHRSRNILATGQTKISSKKMF